MVQTISQCPYSGGDAVILARNFIELFDERIVYDDEATCGALGIYKLSNNVALAVGNVHIVPNPAKDFVNIILSNKSIGVCKVEIHDALGRQIYHSTFDCNKTVITIHTSTFAVGTYEIRVSVNESYLKTSKLVIVR